ncbi:MAG: AAA family ATPase [Planctomycetes bacterium]|nr:AAA family ATPase [Planctomycetota bacterium]MCH8193043.1 AAA family ATPase [Planctomycetota bacterium]
MNTTIESIRLKNFKAFKDVTIRDIPRMCVVVGANGTGKSTLFDVFGFLRDSLTNNVQIALSKRGGFKEVRTRDAEGAIEIELKFRFHMTTKTTQKTPLATYTLALNERNGQVFIEREELRYRRGSHGQPWKFLAFYNGEGEAVTNEFDDVDDESKLSREKQTLAKPSILAIKGLAQFKRYPAVMALGQMIENWHVSDFHISAARSLPDAGYAEHLSREGENLALVTQYLYEHKRDVFDAILIKMANRVPGISKVEAKTSEEGRILLRFQDGAFKDPFLARYVSDGTIKMFAYLVLLYDPSPHPLLCVEEPENQLYPKLLYELAEEFSAYASKGGQVFISTHSPDFLNAVELDSVFWLAKDKESGVTNVKRAKDDKQIAAFMAEGDKMGYLWKQGFFGGVDPL